MFHFYAPRKRQKITGFLMFSGCIEMEQWLKMGYAFQSSICEKFSSQAAKQKSKFFTIYTKIILILGNSVTYNEFLN